MSTLAICRLKVAKEISARGVTRCALLVFGIVYHAAGAIAIAINSH
jgi:hypothetical protein